MLWKKIKIENKNFGYVVFRYISLLIVLSSCSSMGPKTIPVDGFNYNDQIGLQQNEQLLLNIVRLRYAEVPIFLNVSSVINQYSRDARVNIGGNDFGKSPSGNAGVEGGWSDRPTITYTPMSGKAFSESLLQPIPPDVIFFLIQSGWSPYIMMNLTASTINGLNRGSKMVMHTSEVNPEFNTFLNLVSNLQSQNVLGTEISGTDEKRVVSIKFTEDVENDSIRHSILQFKKMLNLNPELNSFPIHYGPIQQNKDGIFIRTHSILEIFINVGVCIEVPKEHIEEGRTFDTTNNKEEILIVHSSKERPENYFVAVNVKDYWFYISDTDYKSKSTFGIIQILMNLTSGGAQSMSPLISIGN